MDDFLKTSEGFQTTLRLIEAINRSTDDYLFIWDIKEDTRWFFGDIDKYYDIRKTGSSINSTQEMMRIIHPSDRAAVLESLKEVMEGKKDVHNMDYRWIDRNGRIVRINCHGTLIRDGDKKPHIMLGRVSEENLRHLYNPLTSLWNKNKLKLDLKERISEGGGFLVLMDIDGLAAINLSHGREYGDKLLKETAHLFEEFENISEAYHVDRSHFAFLLDADSEEAVVSVYEKIKERMQEKCTFTASAVPIDKAIFMDGNQLIDSLNMTHQKAKQQSDNRIEFFSKAELSQKIASLELLEEFTRSIENGFEGFEVYYQPQVKAGSYGIYGVEALLRYNSKTRGMVFPDEFIPILEQSRLINPVGQWVLRTALEQCKKWRDSIPELKVSVNFSVLQFEDEKLAEKIIGEIRRVSLPGNALTVEITESIELHRSRRFIHMLELLKAYNVNFAIDDFGTGYSNLAYLKELNVDEIKIDRSFVSKIENNTYNHRLVSNVIEFAKSNDIRTCCEGVENTNELAVLEFLLPDTIQGYLFSKPTTAQEFESAYINTQTEQFRLREEFLKKIAEMKANLDVLHFDPKDILRENGVGLWVMRVNKKENVYQLFVDETLEKITELKEKLTPEQYYDFFFSNVHPDYSQGVYETFRKMVSTEESIILEFLWKHKRQGDVLVRVSGKCTANDGRNVVLQGYYRILDGVQGA